MITNLYEHIARLAKEHPQKVVLLSCDEAGNTLQEITYAKLLEHLSVAAAGLKKLGLRPNDRVALNFGNCPELLIVSWAAWMSGVVTVPLDTKRDTSELTEFKTSLSKAAIVLSQKDVQSFSGGEAQWMKDLSHEALILFTSGTTARPKGAQLSLKNLVVNADGIAKWLKITPQDRFLVQLPLHHINSTTFCLSALLAGASIAIVPRYSNSHFWQQAARTGSTITSIVQSIVFDQLQRKEAYATSKHDLKLSRIQIGSAPVVAASAKEFIQTFGIPLYQGYGQTETALRVTGVPTDLPEPLFEQLVEENSIGTPLQWAQVEITDEEGKILGENSEGELVVKGPAIMAGYLAGEPAFRDGYFLTGDIGLYKVIEGKRFFYLRGRKSEMIIKGGVNISPVAVENALKKVSADIDQAYVVGVEDERYGQEVGAIIILKSGVEDAAAKRRIKFALLSGSPHLSAYETPKFVRFVTVEELPATSTGKVQRTVLKKSPKESYQSIYDLFETKENRFTVIDPQSRYVRQSHELYNHCWQPLLVTLDAYKKKLSKETTIAAVDTHDQVIGQISFTRDKDTLTCVSICSSAYKAKPIVHVEKIPSPQEVETYLLAGHDPVMNFHTNLGATLMKVIPQGRPDDKSSLGYTMLLKYPSAPDMKITENNPISSQLIEAVRMLGTDIGSEVYALSRPGALAHYMAKQR
ncbi:MAG: class I adenylate-forming enzyme family protein [Patescibacteria group bacterium]